MDNIPGEWKGLWICGLCGTVLPNDKGRSYDAFTETHLTAEFGSYFGNKVCKGTLLPHDRRAKPSPAIHAGEQGKAGALREALEGLKLTATTERAQHFNDGLSYGIRAIEKILGI